MRSYILGTVAILVMAGAAELAQALDDGEMYIEGHVFDSRSLRPISQASVGALALLDTVSIPESGPVPIATAVTDRNGFYQVLIRDADRLRSPSILLTVVCVVTDDDGEFVSSHGGSAEARPVASGLILRRDIYVQTTRRFRRHSTCDPSAELPEPRPISLPPPSVLPSRD